MITNPASVPPPNLRIVRVADVRPHEKSDIQRSQPLMDILRSADVFTNPPLVAEIADDNYVIMDGSNRHVSLQALGFEHILVQIADYNSDFVELGVWQHIVADWDSQLFMEALKAIDCVDLRPGWDSGAAAHAILRKGPVHSIHSGADSLRERNTALRRVVESYHNKATLYRTPLTDPGHIWSLFPTGAALVMFRQYQPQEIIDAAQEAAYLPPGVSRHIIHGRALNLNYPMDGLRSARPLAEKNCQLQAWLRDQYAQRGVRFYAEATYHFDE